MSQKIELIVDIDSKGAITSVRSISNAMDAMGKETDETTASLDRQKKSTDSNALSMKGLAAAAASFFAAWKIKEFFSDSISEAAASEKSLSMLQRALSTTGGAYGRSAEQIRKYAETMQWKVNVENETIEAIQRQLIQYRIAPGLLNRVTEAAINYQKATGDGTVTQERSIEIAKKLALALQHPDVALRALRETGMVFSAQQRKVINEMVAAGDAAKVQQYILQSLEKTYGSTAPATFASSITKIKLAFGELKESFGTGVLEGFQSSGLFKSLTEGLQSEELTNAFRLLGETIGKTFGDVAKVVAENFGKVVSGMRTAIDTLDEITSGLRSALGSVIDFASGITSAVGGLKNLAVAAIAFFAVWKIGALVQGVALFTTAIGSAAFATAAGTAAMNGMVAVTLGASKAFAAFAAALPMVALAALGAEIIYINRLISDLKINMDAEIESEKRHLSTMNQSIEKYRDFRNSVNMTSGQLQQMTRDFSGIEDYGMRVNAMMRAIRDGRYGEKLQSEFKSWNDEWQKSHRTAQQVKQDLEQQAEADENRKQIALQAAEAHRKEIEAATDAILKNIGLSEKAGKNITDQGKIISEVFRENAGEIQNSLTVNLKFQEELRKITAGYVEQRKIIPASIQEAIDKTEKWENQMRAAFAVLSSGVGIYVSMSGPLSEISGLTMTATQKEQDFAAAIQEVTGSIGILSGDTLESLIMKTDATVQAWDENAAAIQENAIQTENMRGIIEALIQQYAAAGVEVPDSLLNVNEALEENERRLRSVLVSVLMVTQGMAGFNTAIGVLNISIPAANRNTVDLSDSIQAIATTTNQAIEAMESLGIISGNTAGILKGLTGGLGSISSGMNVMKTAGSDAIGTLSKIGGVVGMISGAASILTTIIKILKGQSGEMKALKRELGELSGLTQDWAKSLEKVAQGFGGEGSAGRAINKFFDQIIESSDITSRNFSTWVERVRNIFSAFTEGFAGAKETAENFGKAFNAILDDARRLGLEGGLDMTGLILMFEEMKKQGVMVTEILDYINEQTEAGVAGYKAMIDSMDTEGLQARIDELRQKIAFGVPEGEYFDRDAAIEELNALNEQMMTATELQGVFSQATITAYDDILNYRKKLEDNKALVSGIEGWTKALEGFTNTTRISFDQFSGYGQTAVSEYNELLKKNFTDAEALKLLAPQLSRLRMLSQEYNYTLDEPTQKLIDQAAALGLISEKQEKAISDQEVWRDGFGDVTDAIFLLVETLGGKVPEAMRRTSESIAETADDAQKKVEAIDTVAITPEISTAGMDTAAENMNTQLSGVEKAAKTSTDSMNQYFLTVQDTVDRVAASVVDLQLKMKTVDGIPVYGKSGEIDFTGGTYTAQPVARGMVDVNVRVDGTTTAGMKDSDIQQLIRAIRDGMSGGFPSDYQLSEIIKRLLMNNTGGLTDRIVKVKG